MRLRRVLVHRFRTLFQRARVEADLQREFDIHIEQLAREFMAGGMSEAEALLKAKRTFGSISVTGESCRDMRRTRIIDELTRDLIFALRTLKKSPGFTAMALLSLALGIGANTAIYSFMDTILVRALPIPHPENLVVLNWRSQGWPRVVHSQHGDGYDEPGGIQVSGTFPYPAWEMLRDQNQSFSTLFAFAGAGRLNLVVHNQAYLGGGEYVSGNYFSGIGAPPAFGRFIGNDDDRAGAAAVAVISYHFWQHAFDGAGNVVGRTVLVNQKPFAVIGVTAPEFYGLNLRDTPDLFLPLHAMAQIDPRLRRGRNWFQERDNYWLEMMGRLRPGISLREAEIPLAVRFHNFAASTAKNEKERSNLPALWLEEGGSGIDSLRRRYSKPLFVLIAMTGLILAIACANLANLLLSRATARRREIAVRLSLGAGQWRIIRQLLTESVLIALVGGVLGLLVAAAGIRFLSWLLTAGQDGMRVLATIDLRTLLFAVLVSIITGIVFGLAPAIQATKVDVTPVLKEMRAAQRMRRFGLPFGLSHVLVVGQIAFSLLLVIASGLFVTTLAKLHAVSLGFNKENLLVFNLNAQIAGYDEQRGAVFYESLRKRFATIPGVRAATMTDMPLVSGSSSANSFTMPGLSKQNGNNPSSNVMIVGPGFFDAMQIPILLGRAIDEHDSVASPRFVVVNELFAKKFLPGRNPIGQHFAFENGQPLDCEIVGVSEDTRYASLTREDPPIVYLSWAQPPKGWMLGGMYFELRTVGNPLALANTIRQIVHNKNPTIPVADISTQVRYMDANIAPERTFANLCTCFSALALLIACVGLYGTMAYTVARRTNEMGIRIALGARRGRVFWMVVAEVLVLASIGLAIGIGVAWEAARLVASFLFGVHPHDMFVLVSSAAVLAICAFIAGAVPAWRASHIEPMKALRHE